MVLVWSVVGVVVGGDVWVDGGGWVCGRVLVLGCGGKVVKSLSHQ